MRRRLGGRQAEPAGAADLEGGLCPPQIHLLVDTWNLSTCATWTNHRWFALDQIPPHRITTCVTGRESARLRLLQRLLAACAGVCGWSSDAKALLSVSTRCASWRVLLRRGACNISRRPGAAVKAAPAGAAAHEEQLAGSGQVLHLAAMSVAGFPETRTTGSSQLWYDMARKFWFSITDMPTTGQGEFARKRETSYLRAAIGFLCSSAGWPAMSQSPQQRQSGKTVSWREQRAKTKSGSLGLERWQTAARWRISARTRLALFRV